MRGRAHSLWVLNHLCTDHPVWETEGICPGSIKNNTLVGRQKANGLDDWKKHLVSKREHLVDGTKCRLTGRIVRLIGPTVQLIGSKFAQLEKQGRIIKRVMWPEVTTHGIMVS